MKVIIAGGRTFKPTREHKELLVSLDEKYSFTEIISGKSKGADTFGEEYAKSLSIPVKEFPADWKNLSVEPCVIKYNQYGSYNALAGHNRNKKMAEYADAVILFKGGRGTANMKKLAVEHNLEILYEEN